VCLHVVPEVLGVHLVHDLRERLPSLEERGEVLHLPPQVESLVVDGLNGSVCIKASLEIVEWRVNNFVRCATSLDHKVAGSVDVNVHG
jgi:hypothetical protein